VGDPQRWRFLGLAAALCGAGLYAMASTWGSAVSPSGFALRALLGYALVLAGLECGLRAAGLSPGAGFFRGRLGVWRALSSLGLSALLTPVLLFMLLLTKESGPEWTRAVFAVLAVVVLTGGASVVGLLLALAK
jgi:hypothetical protein